MRDIRPVKVIRVGSSLSLVIPALICRELKIHRGEFFDLRVVDGNTILARKLKVVDAENTANQITVDVPIIHYER